MFRYRGGQKVQRGTYWCLASGHREDIEADGVLPGDESAGYVRLPAGLMLVAGPFIGLLYVIALPFIAIATVISLAAGVLVGGLAGLTGRSFSFMWRPSESYLSGRKRKKK